MLTCEKCKKFTMYCECSERGFSLLELLIVLTILGILAPLFGQLTFGLARQVAAASRAQRELAGTIAQASIACPVPALPAELEEPDDGCGGKGSKGHEHHGGKHEQKK